MPSNAEMIEIQLYDMLRETKQWGTLDWSAVVGYCIGYYETITNDHLVAIKNLERLGALMPCQNCGVRGC